MLHTSKASLKWQASKNALLCLLCSFCYNGIIILYMYSRSSKWVLQIWLSQNYNWGKLGTFLRLFWSQNMGLFPSVSIDIYFNKFVHIYVCVGVFYCYSEMIECFACLKICHIDVKCGKISLHLKLTLFVWDMLLLNGLVYVTFNILLVKYISLK